MASIFAVCWSIFCLIARFGTPTTNPSWYHKNLGTSSSFQGPRSSVPAETSDTDKAEKGMASLPLEDTARIGFVYKCPSCAAVFDSDDMDASTNPSQRSLQVPTQEKTQDCSELGIAIVVALLYVVIYT